MARRRRFPLLRTLLKSMLMALLSVVTFGLAGASARNLSEIESQGRDALLYRAKSVAGQPAPLVMVLHGGFQSGEKMYDTLRLDKAAERFGFNVIYPTGTRLKLNRKGPLVTRKGGMNAWNAGLKGRGMLDTTARDVEYLSGLVDRLVAEGVTDPARVTIVGHSNGAMMAYKLVCERPDLARRVIAISGTPAIPACTADLSGLRILHLHGTEDDNQPAKGGVGSKGVSQHNARSVDDTVAMMEAAGAEIRVRLIRGGGHRIDELNAPARRQYKASVAEMVAGFAAGQTD
ncbi:alpha/beta hydrolase family esterase [Dinoroseobacter sp. S375]|uniref:alpha/beta hydrolase family esterase n=1 Tax=Dinoroseobacter sp. S375 TaxID=3415136 RepID=UPI003C7E001B